MEDTQKLIEKYKRELMEMSRNAQSSRATGSSDNRPAENRANETRPAENRPAAEKPVKNPAKTPKVIGYVTEESSDFHSVFDRFITEAVENNEIETVRTEDPDYLDMPNGTDIPDDIEIREPDIGTNKPDNTDSAEDIDNAPNNDFNAELPRNSFDNSDRPNPEDDMDQGTGESISDFPVSEFANLSEFEAKNNCGGSLEFRVFAAREALPIANAAVVVTTRINGRAHEMFSANTDSSGETRAMLLPAPSKELSQNSRNGVQPFALYDASVEKEGYAKVILRDIPIFDGVMSIQRVAMIPEIEFTAENSPDIEIDESNEMGVEQDAE